MSIGRLCDEMTYEELLGWEDYFERRPVGWREDDRTFKILQSNGVKAKAGEIFPSLAAIHKSQQMINSEGTDLGTLKGSQFFMQMVTAKGGDSLDL